MSSQQHVVDRAWANMAPPTAVEADQELLNFLKDQLHNSEQVPLMITGIGVISLQGFCEFSNWPYQEVFDTFTVEVVLWIKEDFYKIRAFGA